MGCWVAGGGRDGSGMEEERRLGGQRGRGSREAGGKALERSR